MKIKILGIPDEDNNGMGKWMSPKLYYSNEMTPNGNSNSEKQMKKTRNGKNKN